MENANYSNKNQINGCLGMGWWKRMDYKGVQELLGVINRFIILIVVMFHGYTHVIKFIKL